MIEEVGAFNQPNFTNDNIIFLFERIEKFLISSMIFKGACDKKRLNKYLGIPINFTAFQHNNYFFFLKDELIKFSIIVKENLKKKGTKYIQEIHDNCIKKGTNFVSETEKISKDYEKGKIDALTSFKQYSELCIDFCTYYTLALFEKAMTSIAEELAEKYKNKDYPKEKLFELFTSSPKNTAAEDEMEDFLKIVIKKLEKGNANIKDHAKKYNWLSLRYFYGEPWTEKEILERMKSYTLEEAKNELNIRIETRKNVELDIEKISKTMGKKDIDIVKQVRNTVFLRTYRADIFQNASLFILPILKKIAKSFGMSFDLLRCLSYKEVLNFRKEYKELAKQRAKNILISHKEGIALVDKDIEELFSKYSAFKVQHIKSDKLKGSIAYKGKAKGHVKIIKTNEDIKKVEKGDILVAVMTTPNFVPAMEKASAFITDEGGILCHAAIVSREMRKPCIIATKNATRTFKDGDLVEVDADKGIVRVIK